MRQQLGIHILLLYHYMVDLQVKENTKKSQNMLVVAGEDVEGEGEGVSHFAEDPSQLSIVSSSGPLASTTKTDGLCLKPNDLPAQFSPEDPDPFNKQCSL